jgi:predicted transport protein
MAIFLTTNSSAKQLKKQNFRNEKELQTFVEQNMESLFGIRFLASEFTTSKQHGGRIDSLGLDENNSPVIIEYKWDKKDNIINQGLFYLDWLVDHKGDFQLLVQNKLGNNIDVDFGSPRVLLVAQTFSKYDQYAINRMAENIELWGYSHYEDNIFELKLVASSQAKKATNTAKQITKVNYEEYSVEDHIKNKSEQIKELFSALREKIFALESEQKIEENPRKHYVSYRTNKNFSYIHIQSKTIKVHLAMKKEEFDDPKNILIELPKGVQLRGTYCEAVLKSFDELDYVVGLIEQSYLQSI